MRILFYSTSCNFCIKLLEYIDKNNLGEYFKIICIDNTPNIPKNITLVPTIIDTTIESPLEGKKAFEYVINQKYFNHPTNNIEYLKNGVPKPTVEEDALANTSRSGSGFIYINKDAEKRYHGENQLFETLDKKSNQVATDSVNMLINQRNIEDKKLQMLMKLRK